MLGARVKGTTYLFGDNKSMVTNTSLPHSSLKKQVSANNYHRIREAVASKIVSIVHCDTEYNLSDMGTKALNGTVHQRLLQNQKFPPVSSAGECQKAFVKPSVELEKGKALLHLTMLTPMDAEVWDALEEQTFQNYLLS